MMPSLSLLAALVAGLLSVERKAFLQAMFSRPLVAGTLLGLALGRPLEGLGLGAALELFFLGAVNIGASLPDNDLFTTSGAVCCAGALASSAPLPLEATLAVSVLLALPMAKLGKSVDRLNEHLNGWAAAHAQRRGKVRARLRYNLFGLWLPFVATGAVALGGSLVGAFALPPFFAESPPALPRALAVVWGAFLMVAAATALCSIRTLHAGAYAAAAALVAAGAQAVRTFAF
ncbi:MAG: PTS sugar transporter subunit IIC [Myxococcales bacterium]|jgi:mannose/fructose/N-acetylgalactosamine-specific phosphotransferase system component IIC